MGDVENTYFIQTINWLNAERSKAIKTAVKEWPDDYKFLADTAFWFEQVFEAVNSNPPTDNVRRIVVKEKMFYRIIIGIEYEYYGRDDPNIGEMAFRITAVSDKKT